MRLTLVALTAAMCARSAPTFYRDVLPVLQQKCQNCHRKGEAAPMPLTAYDEVRPWARAIREAVLTRRMPPWFADPHHGEFTNDSRLTAQESGTLVAWVDAGSPEGAPKDAPPTREFVEGWTIGTPDVVYELPADFAVPASGTVPYMLFVVPTGFKEDKWIEKIEIRPGNRSVVHHAVLQVRAPGTKYIMDAQPGVPFEAPLDPVKTGEDRGEGEFGFLPGEGVEAVAVFVPGGAGNPGAPGCARLVKAGSDFIFEMHYTLNGKPAIDRTRVGIIFSRTPPVRRVINALIVNERLRIPPGAANHASHARIRLHQDVEITSLMPHMHLRGKAFTFRAIYPDGSEEILLDVPSYDFNWQLTYYLKTPKRLPVGSFLECVAHYDNSPNNPFNPDSSKEVRWGNQTWEEMLIGFVDFSLPVGVDPRLIAQETQR